MIPDENNTKTLLLNALKTHGDMTVKELSKHLGLTQMGVRIHIHALRDEGILRGTLRSKGRGRPSTAWSLTDQARHFFPDKHDALAVNLLDTIRQTFGDDGLDRLINTRSAQQIQHYQALMSPTDTLLERTQKLAQARTNEGYMCTVQELDEPNTYLLSEDHCPICSAARTCQGLCAGELHVFRTVLGPNATVKRTEHILDGARRCAYIIRTDA